MICRLEGERIGALNVLTTYKLYIYHMIVMNVLDTVPRAMHNTFKIYQLKRAEGNSSKTENIWRHLEMGELQEL